MSRLFEQMNLGTLQARNRIVRAATCESWATDEGHLTPKLVHVHEELAQGGVGTIITGYAHILPDEQPYPHMLGIYDDSFIEDFRQLADIAHSHDTRVVAQIAYGGSNSNMHPPCWRVLGPSAVTHPKSGVTPTAITDEHREELVNAFVAAALRVQAAGFDGVEIHSAHGYLLSQFLNPFFNKRNDNYGGAIQNRARFGCEIIAAVRKAVGPDFPLLAKVNCRDNEPSGMTEEESLEAMRLYAEAGLTALEISGGWRVPTSNEVRAMQGKPFFADYAMKLLETVDVPIILTGGVRSIDALEDLACAGIAGFGICRPLICEPDLPLRWKHSPSFRPRCLSCGGCDLTEGHRCILNSSRSEK